MAIRDICQHLSEYSFAWVLDPAPKQPLDPPAWGRLHKSGYLLFTQGYRPYLEHAQRAGWPSRTLAAGHFHMLVDPVAVAMTLVELMKQMNEKL